MTSMKRYGHPLLPFPEQVVYWLTWLFFALYPFYDGYRMSVKYFKHLPETKMLVKGLFSYYKDDSDFEWEYWRSFSYYFFPSIILNFLLTKVIERFLPRYILEFQTIFAVVVISTFISIQGFLFLILHPIIFLLLLNTKHPRLLMWVFSISQLWALHEDSLFNFVMKKCSVDYEKRNLLNVTLLMCYLRMLSFGTYFSYMRTAISSKSNRKEEKEDEKDKFDNVVIATYKTQILFWHYLFYLPLLFNGPVLTYPKYKQQIFNRKKYPKNEIIFDVLTCGFYSFLLELSLYFIYITSISNLDYLLEELNGWQSTSISWMHLQKFLIKYIVFYRACGIFTKLDGLIPPGAPKCISSLYMFTVMWRDFDRGLHHLLQQIIYFPIGGSRFGLMRQLCAIFCCFGFIALWHGNGSDLWIWSVTNCLGVIVEAFATSFVKCKMGVKLRHYLTPLVYRRICAMSGSICIYFLIYTNTIFLTTYSRATILLKNINFASNIVILFVLYTSAQCSIDVN